MMLKDRVVWALSWVAPVAGWTTLVAFGALVAWPQMRQAAGEGKIHAWIIALLALLWCFGHLAVRLHGTYAAGLSRDDKVELRWKLNVGKGYAHWRDLMRRQGHTWYGGRSHSGGRPRYD